MRGEALSTGAICPTGQVQIVAKRSLKVEAAIRKRNIKETVVTCTLVAESENREKVLKMCKDFVAQTHKMMEAAPNSGLVSFTCEEDGLEKGTFHFWQRYTDTASMSKFLATKEYTTFLNKVRVLLKAPMGLAMYELSDGQLGPSAYPYGPKGEGGLDDATGQGTGGGAGMQQHAQVDFGNFVREREDEEDGKGRVWGLQKMLEKIIKK
eukprot:jgi/Mesvir1/16735/Mv15118-RA.1